jgi:hypothetical protein
VTSRVEISRLILGMQHYPNSPITDMNAGTVIDAFEDTLCDLDFETVQAAVRQYQSTETFFPTPGKLREIAMDLQMLAMGVPTASEAWGMVLTAEKHVPSVWCEVGAELRRLCLESYGPHSSKYDIHMRDCEICKNGQGGLREVYAHSVVEETVKILGGRDVIITDNPTADRARFIDAYREIVARERRKAAMTPEVKAYVTETRQNLLENKMKQLTQGMTK